MRSGSKELNQIYFWTWIRMLTLTPKYHANSKAAQHSHTANGGWKTDVGPRPIRLVRSFVPKNSILRDAALSHLGSVQTGSVLPRGVRFRGCGGYAPHRQEPVYHVSKSWYKIFWYEWSSEQDGDGTLSCFVYILKGQTLWSVNLVSVSGLALRVVR